jgi:hypothetical protein
MRPYNNWLRLGRTAVDEHERKPGRGGHGDSQDQGPAAAQPRCVWVRRRVRGAQFRILTQDRTLELPESRTRLDPQFLAQGHSAFAVDLEGFCLPTSSVERRHELAAGPLAKWMDVDELAELADERIVAPEREVGVNPILHRRKPKLLEPLSLWARECFVRQIRESRPPPELERRSKTLAGGSRIAVVQELPPFACKAGEPVRIELLLADAQGVTGRL